MRVGMIGFNTLFSEILKYIEIYLIEVKFGSNIIVQMKKRNNLLDLFRLGIMTYLRAIFIFNYELRKVEHIIDAYI